MELEQGGGVPVDAGAVLGHGQRMGVPEAHAVAPAVGGQLKPEYRVPAGFVAIAEQGQP